MEKAILAGDVMIDRDLAEMYGVETKVLNQAVKRNLKRFPADFMFPMTSKELSDWKSQNVTSNLSKERRNNECNFIGEYKIYM